MNQTTDQIKIIIMYLITILIILALSIFLFFLYFVNDDMSIKIIGTIAVVLVILVWLFFEYHSKNKVVHIPKVYDSEIKKLILITRDGEREKEWYCEGMNSFLVGKGTTSKEVDIELGDTHYTEYISNEHAILNYSDGYWYIEDLESLNGVGLKKKGDDFALRLKPLTPYKVDEGDLIYISKAKILVR